MLNTAIRELAASLLNSLAVTLSRDSPIFCNALYLRDDHLSSYLKSSTRIETR
jgi:hypothetical protein